MHRPPDIYTVCVAAGLPGCNAPVTIDLVADGCPVENMADSAMVSNTSVTTQLSDELPNLQEMTR